MDEAVPTYFNFARDVIDTWARQQPDARALWIVEETSRREHTFTFAQLSELSRRAASFFADVGIERGDRVMVILPRVPQWWIAMLGLIRLGAVPIPGTPLLTAKDIAYRLDAAGMRAIITDDLGAPKVLDFPGVRILAGGERPGWVSLDHGLAQADPQFDPPPTRGDDPGIIYFTSGTSGMPKMALHTQASYGLGHRITGKYWLDLKPGDLHWALADTGWGKAAWSNFFGPWQMGACVFVVDARGKFDAISALQTLSSYPITTFCSPPTALRLLVQEDLSQYRFPKLRHCVAAGEALGTAVFHQWKAGTGHELYEGYGQTETVLLVGNFRSLGHPIRPGSMGRPAPGFELAVLDDTLEPVAPGQDGLLAIHIKHRRPVGLFKEYWRNPQETAHRFRGDWYITGDVVRRDADGYLWFVSRSDDVINSSSYRIGPFEVESALSEHPAVLECAVVGKSDELRGQIVKAFVVLRRGRVACDALRHELQEHCKRVTAPYKYPREVEFVEEMPKTISGKIRRVELRQQAS